MKITELKWGDAVQMTPLGMRTFTGSKVITTGIFVARGEGKTFKVPMISVLLTGKRSVRQYHQDFWESAK